MFLATPHTGAALSTIAKALPLVGITVNATQLARNEPHLTAWYSNNVKKYGIRSLAYYEKGTVKGIKVVDEMSADPHVEDCNPVPSDENHIDICKPKGSGDPVFLGIRCFVESLLGRSTAADEAPSEGPRDYNIDTIFGMHRGDTCHYVERVTVDNAFIGQLVGDKHLCLYGSSKQGKTALRKRHIDDTQAVAVVCDRKWSSIDVFAAILKEAKCVVNKSDEPSIGASTVRLPRNGHETLDIDLGHTADFLSF